MQDLVQSHGNSQVDVITGTDERSDFDYQSDNATHVLVKAVSDRKKIETTATRLLYQRSPDEKKQGFGASLYHLRATDLGHVEISDNGRLRNRHHLVPPTLAGTPSLPSEKHKEDEKSEIIPVDPKPSTEKIEGEDGEKETVAWEIRKSMSSQAPMKDATSIINQMTPLKSSRQPLTGRRSKQQQHDYCISGVEKKQECYTSLYRSSGIRHEEVPGNGRQRKKRRSPIYRRKGGRDTGGV